MIRNSWTKFCTLFSSIQICLGNELVTKIFIFFFLNLTKVFGVCSRWIENYEEQIYFTSELAELWNSHMVEWKHCKRLNCVLTESSRIIWLQGYLGLATWNIIIFNIILKVFWGRTGHYEELLRVKLEIGEGEKNPPFYQNLQNDFFFAKNSSDVQQMDWMTPLQLPIIFFNSIL